MLGPEFTQAMIFILGYYLMTLMINIMLKNISHFLTNQRTSLSIICLLLLLSFSVNLSATGMAKVAEQAITVMSPKHIWLENHA